MEKRIQARGRVLLGALAMISGNNGGPTTCPRVATGPMIIIPVMLAMLCHWPHAEQIASQIPSINEVN